MPDRPNEGKALKPVASTLMIDLAEFERFQSNPTIDRTSPKTPLTDLIVVTDAPVTEAGSGKQTMKFTFAGKSYTLEFNPNERDPQKQIRVLGPDGQPVKDMDRFRDLRIEGKVIKFSRPQLGSSCGCEVEINTETGTVSVSNEKGRVTRYANGVRTYEVGRPGETRLTYIKDQRGNLYEVQTDVNDRNRIVAVSGLQPPLDAKNGPIEFDKATGRITQRLEDGRVVTYTAGDVTVETKDGKSTAILADGRRISYTETTQGADDQKKTERVFDQTPFGAGVKVTYDAQGKPVSITDKNGHRIPGLEVTPDGKIVFTQGANRVVLNEFLAPTELQTRNSSNGWDMVAKVGEAPRGSNQKVVSIQIDEAKNIVWKLEEQNGVSQGFALTGAGYVGTSFKDRIVDGKIIREFDNTPGAGVVIQLQDGKEVVVGRWTQRGGQVPVNPGQLDPLTGGEVSIETRTVSVGTGAPDIQVKYQVTTLPGGVVVKRELEADGKTIRENGQTEISVPERNQSVTTSIVRRNADGSTNTEVTNSKDSSARVIYERDSEGKIKSIRSRKAGQTAESTVSFEYNKDGELIEIRVQDGTGPVRLFQKVGPKQWNGFSGDPYSADACEYLVGPDKQPMRNYDLDPQLNQQTGLFTMRLEGFEAPGQPGDRRTADSPRDVPSGPPGDAPTKDADYVRQVRCQPKLIGFDPVTGKPIWRFSAHPNYVPGAACTRWQFAPQVNEKGIMTDQGYRMNFSRTTGPDGRIQVQVAEFPECPNGVAWKMSDGSVVTGVHKVETRWDNEKGCYVTTLFGKNGQPLKQMYVSEDGNEYDPVRRTKIDDGLDNPRVRAGANDTVPFDARRQELSDKVGNGMATYDNTSSNDPPAKAVAKQGARDAIGDYRRAIYQEIERIRQEVYAQGGDANMLAAAFKQKLEAKGLLAELKRLDDAEARLR